MNFRLILNIMGYTLWVEAGCLLLPLLVSAGYGEACWEPFLWTLGLCSLCGLILTRIPARKNRLQGRLCGGGHGVDRAVPVRGGALRPQRGCPPLC